MFEAFRNMEGANDDLDNAMNEKRKPKQEVKSLKKFLAAFCDLVQDQTEDLFNEISEVEESRDRSKKSEYAIEEMIAKATSTEIEERKEKLRLKAEKQESDPSLKGKRAILCQNLIKPEDRIAMSWSLAIEGKKLVTSLCSWVALTPELIVRGINFHVYHETKKKDVTIPMQAAKQLLKDHEDCVDGYIELKGNYDIEDVREVRVVLNEDCESLFDNEDNEEIGDEEMGVALEDNEGNGGEQIVNE
jgi:hypothetical protein